MYPVSRCLVNLRGQHTADGACLAAILLPTETRRKSPPNSVTQRCRYQLPPFAVTLHFPSRQSCNPPEKPMCRSDLEESGQCDWRRPPPAGCAPSLPSVDGCCFSTCKFLCFASFDSRTLPVTALVCCCLQAARERETQIMLGTAGADSDVRWFSSKGFCVDFLEGVRSIHPTAAGGCASRASMVRGAQ